MPASTCFVKESTQLDDRRQKPPSIIPRHHTIKCGTLKQILDAAEISLEHFNDLL